MMDKPQKVTAYLKVTAEFYDPEATPETVRACVEQDLKDAGYEVDVSSFGNWIPVKDRLPESAGCATLVTAVNAYGQKFVFEAFLGYGDMHWYTLDTTKMQKHGSNRVDSGWTITHWMGMPNAAEDEEHDSD